MKDTSEFGPSANERKVYAVALFCLMAALKDADVESLTSMEILDRAEAHALRCFESHLQDQSALSSPTRKLLAVARRALLQIGPDRDPSDLVSDLIH